MWPQSSAVSYCAAPLEQFRLKYLLKDTSVVAAEEWVNIRQSFVWHLLCGCLHAVCNHFGKHIQCAVTLAFMGRKVLGEKGSKDPLFAFVECCAVQTQLQNIPFWVSVIGGDTSTY